MDLNHNDDGQPYVTNQYQELCQVDYYQPSSLSKARQPNQYGRPPCGPSQLLSLAKSVFKMLLNQSLGSTRQLGSQVGFI